MQIDWWTLGLQTINFLIVVWLLTRFLYRPVRRMIDEREAADRRLADEAAERTAAAERIRAEYDAKIRELAQGRQAQEAELHAEMQRERDAARGKAQADADALVAAARARLAREREDAFSGLKSDIAALATDLARTALAAGASADAALRRAREHFGALPASDLAELGADAIGHGEPVTVTTPAPLSAADRAAWEAMMAEVFGPGVTLAFAERPELLGGAELHFPHAVLDLSVAGRLRAAADLVKV